MSVSQTSDETEQHDGFNVEETVSLQEWVDFGYDEVGEYIHLIPDVENRELRCYRSIDETGKGNLRLKTTIENVSFAYHFHDESSEKRAGETDELNSFYLTYSEAMTFMTVVDLMSRGREGRLNLTWWEESGKPMNQDTRTKEETLIFKFTKSNGVERESLIASTWQTPTHKMANIEGEGFGQ